MSLRVIPQEVRPEVVEKLRRYLSMAERGELAAVVLVTDRTDGEVEYGYAGRPSAALVGALVLTQKYLCEEIDGD